MGDLKFQVSVWHPAVWTNIFYFFPSVYFQAVGDPFMSNAWGALMIGSFLHHYRPFRATYRLADEAGMYLVLGGMIFGPGALIFATLAPILPSFYMVGVLMVGILFRDFIMEYGSYPFKWWGLAALAIAYICHRIDDKAHEWLDYGWLHGVWHFFAAIGLTLLQIEQ